MIIFIFLIIIFIFLVYFFIDMIVTANFNRFLDNWMRKVLWIWLPIYGLFRLSKEVFGKKK